MTPDRSAENGSFQDDLAAIAGFDVIPRILDVVCRTGLGLYIASEIARAHGGTLTVTSSAAETTFRFRLPLAGRRRTR